MNSDFNTALSMMKSHLSDLKSDLLKFKELKRQQLAQQTPEVHSQIKAMD